MPINTGLSALLDYMLEVQLKVSQSLADAELTTAGSAENWSIKDALAHNGEWASRHLAELEAIERGEAWPENDCDDVEDEENQKIFETYQDSDWVEVEAMLGNAYGQGQAFLDRISEEMLLAPLPLERERPVWRHVATSFVTHPMIHVWEYLVKSGHSDLLDTYFGKSFSERLLALSDDARWRGTTLYNQACILARSGKTEQAIEQLAEALRLEPGLTEWSQQDADLDSLRDHPAYQTLHE